MTGFYMEQTKTLQSMKVFFFSTGFNFAGDESVFPGNLIRRIIRFIWRILGKNR